MIRMNLLKELIYEIIPSCKNDCLFCSSNYDIENHIPYKKIIEVIKDFNQIKGRHLTLSGGDPTEHPDFLKIIMYSKNKFKKISVLSNNTFYNNSNFIEILKKYRLSLSISILGEKKTHNYLMGKKNYDKISDLYKLCKENKIPIECHFVLTRINYEELYLVLKKFPELKVLRLMPQGKAYENWNILSLPESKIKYLLKGIKFKTGNHITLPICYKGSCNAGIDHVLITPLGSVVPCASIKRYSIKLGNIYEQRFKEIISEENPLLKKWYNIKSTFMRDDTKITKTKVLKNNSCWGYYLHDGMKHPLSYNKLLKDFRIFDADYSKWEEYPNNVIYVSGAHGVGKTTLIQDIVRNKDVFFYKNDIKNPYHENVKKRQLWRLYKYKFDEENLNSLDYKDIIVNRCPLDWLIYTKTFHDLDWLSENEFTSLKKRYYELFGSVCIPRNILYLNPSEKWSLDRIIERWDNIEAKWREKDFEYYTYLRKNYDDFMKKIKSFSNLMKITETSRANRVNIISNLSHTKAKNVKI